MVIILWLAGRVYASFADVVRLWEGMMLDLQGGCAAQQRS